MSVVLVADDEPAVLEVLSEVIEDLGHEVLRAANGHEALRMAREHLPQLIVTDHMMPRLSGLDLCRELRQDDRLKSTPIILLSAVLSQGAPEAQAFLAKPFELADFETLVERMLQGSPAPATASRSAEPSVPASEANSFLQRVSERIQAATAALRNLPVGPAAAVSTLEELESLAGSVADAARLAEGGLSLSAGRADFKEFLSEVVSDFRKAHPGLEVSLFLPPERVELDFDARRIRQALLALLENAAVHGAPPPKVTVELELSPTLAVVKVADQGRGIPASEQRGLFERFGRPLGKTAGLGTGLFIASALARLHGGALAVRSEPGNGSIFTLGLPRSA